jgi:general secretion pathway protein D
MQSSRIGRQFREFFSQWMGRVAVASLLVMLGFAFAGASAHAQSAGSWAKRGANAEAREDYDAAFEDYRQAHLKKPKDLRYRTHYERMRFTAANMHVDRGRVLRQSGDTSGAVNEFARALQIDPGNQAAAQELQVTEKQTGAGGEASAPGVGGPGKVLVPGLDEQTPHQTEVQRDIESIQGPV